ncbi:PHP domain-containing protein [Streptomyces zaomyceticus]|uniref:PHP domain-containing protein n=2 Tax=Streptomyces zaomyceticus TaxID=68286 RepID=UPI003990D581
MAERRFAPFGLSYECLNRLGRGAWEWERAYEFDAGAGRCAMPGFTHLHTASGYSLRYGASHPERLAARAAERGMDALALTDRDTLAGTIRFAKACAKAGSAPCRREGRP